MKKGIWAYSIAGAVISTAASASFDQAKTLEQVQAALARSPLTPEQKVQHALNRLGYGANPAAKGVGLKTFIRYKLDAKGNKVIDSVATDREIANWVVANIARVSRPEAAADAQTKDFAIVVKTPLGDMNVTPATTAQELLNMSFRLADFVNDEKNNEEDRFKARSARSSIANAAVTVERMRKVGRALVAKYPLGEALDDFWFNHFNVASIQGNLGQMTIYRNAIRRNIGNNFHSLLRTTAREPAMLVYLDNYRNFRPVNASRGINENYAREVMELHTLGEGPNLGTYVQADVFQAARILTGLTIKGQNREAPASSYFCASCHDLGTKTVMGKTFPQGEAGQEEFLKFLADHPRTAKNIAAKLVNRFALEPSANTVAENQRIALEKKVLSAFTANKGSLLPVYAALFSAPEFWGAHAYQAKVKQPFEWVISAYRQAGIGSEVPLTQQIVIQAVNQTSQMGQALFAYPFPTGYKDANGMWANSNSINFAVGRSLALAQNHQAGVRTLKNNYLKFDDLEHYFRIGNRGANDVCFQNEHGRTVTHYCGFGGMDMGGQYCFPYYTYLPANQMYPLASRMIRRDVFDFEGIEPATQNAQAMLNLMAAGKADIAKKLPQPVKSQLALLLASPRFMKK